MAPASKVSPAKINTSTKAAATSDGRQIEVIELSSSPSPQETSSNQQQPVLGPRTLTASSEETPKPQKPTSAASASGAPRAPHSTFKPVKIHTAKCDICNKHNKATLHRCVECGWQICTPCWDARGGDGSHGTTRKFTGEIYQSSDEDEKIKPPKTNMKAPVVKKPASGSKAGPASKGTSLQQNTVKNTAARTTDKNPVERGRTERRKQNTRPSKPENTGGRPGGVNQLNVPAQVENVPLGLDNSENKAYESERQVQSDSIASSSNDQIVTGFPALDSFLAKSDTSSLSQPDEEFEYRAPAENPVNPEDEFVIARGKAYKKRPFRDLSPDSELRMNWLLIAAEEVLQDDPRAITVQKPSNKPIRKPSTTQDRNKVTKNTYNNVGANIRHHDTHHDTYHETRAQSPQFSPMDIDQPIILPLPHPSVGQHPVYGQLTVQRDEQDKPQLSRPYNQRSAALGNSGSPSAELMDYGYSVAQDGRIAESATPVTRFRARAWEL
ncbi:hypothetical protein FQN57_004003 [Myotisia sp. PD_48]|nr:hypothetical protein FQN57_004003 [Myotisia sp. PD_48]